jgi:hypothetical protein
MCKWSFAKDANQAMANFSWLVGRLVGWLAGWLVGWLVG